MRKKFAFIKLTTEICFQWQRQHTENLISTSMNEEADRGEGRESYAAKVFNIPEKKTPS